MIKAVKLMKPKVDVTSCNYSIRVSVWGRNSTSACIASLLSTKHVYFSLVCVITEADWEARLPGNVAGCSRAGFNRYSL